MISIYIAYKNQCIYLSVSHALQCVVCAAFLSTVDFSAKRCLVLFSFKVKRGGEGRETVIIMIMLILIASLSLYGVPAI